MSMIFKSILTGVVSTVSAAGVVWFGTSPDATNAHPHGPVASQNADDRVDTRGTGSDSASARVKVMAADSDTQAGAGKAQAGDEEPKRRWIDRYIKRDDAELDMPEITIRDDNPTYMKERESRLQGKVDAEGLAEAKRQARQKPARDAETYDAETDDAETDDAGPQKEARREIRRVIIKGGDAESREMMEEFDVEAEMDSAGSGKVRKRIVIRTSDDLGLDAGELDGDALDTLVNRLLRDAEIADISADLPEKGMLQSRGLRAYEKADPARLLATTGAIEDANLRDQALYAVSTYALRFDDFGTATEAVSRMGDEALRDTATSKVAIRHGEIGELDRAMEVIGTLENEELRDIIRVQLVETLTTPLEERGKRVGY